MRRYLLDTGPLSAFLFNRPAVLSLVSPWIRQREAASSILVHGEVVEYLHSFPDFHHRHAQLRTLMREITPHFLTYRIVERYAQLRRQMRRPHGTGLVGDVDTLIAATALERDLTVVTMDEDYRRIPGLKVMLLPRRQNPP